MTLLWNHMYLIGGLVMLVNLAIGRVRMRGLIAAGALSQVKANRFCVNAAVALAVTSGVFEALTVLTGLPTHCQLLLPMAHRSLWPFYGLTVLAGGALLYWVWRRGGDQTLAAVAPAFVRGIAQDKKYTPQQVRVGLTAILVLAWGGFIAMRLTMPMPSPTEFPPCAEQVG